MSKNILVIEDEPKISEFIASYVKNAGYNPVCAYNGKDALNLYHDNSIDLILLDLMLPDITGEEICRQLRSTSDIPIIMITAKTDEDSIINGLKIGADDYITKPFSPRQMVARISALFRRADLVATNSSSDQKTTGPFTIYTDQYYINYENHNLNLTSTEYVIFSNILLRPAKVFTRDELADQMQNGEYEGYTRSIDSHIKNIRNKISKHANIDYIKTVRGIGYQYRQ